MKIAIIGASTGQYPLCLTAKRTGAEVICFAWKKDAVCHTIVDKFFPVSILEKDLIVDICRKERVDGIVTNASDLTAEVSAYVAEKLKLMGNKYDSVRLIQNKLWVRQQTDSISGLTKIRYLRYKSGINPFFPCIVKPFIDGHSKKGVSLVTSPDQFHNALDYASQISDNIIIEEFIEGDEISVESLSYKGSHYVIQITDKITTGPPHFVEMEHHQPAQLSVSLKKMIAKVVPQILTAVGFENGASHIEFKINNGHIYLIEINPRGGGDEISNTLIKLSTGYDYLLGMIQISTNSFHPPILQNPRFAGIYYLCKQSSYLLDFFRSTERIDWVFAKEYDNSSLINASGNYDRNGYLIYCCDHRINLKPPLDD